MTSFLSSALVPGVWNRRRRLRIFALALIVLATTSSWAGDAAKITFSLDFPGSQPERYSIAVDAEGHSRFECSARISADSDDRETYELKFEITPANRARIFDLAAQANYFSGKVDSGNRKLAFTGAKKLVYEDGEQNSSASYNYSSVVPVAQLTGLFQRMASTLDYGRRLAYFHRYQKLALDDELKRMESQAKGNELSELQAVRPVLQAIIDDSTVINVVRSRAQRLVEMGKAGDSNASR
jgi:hypothetical protein